MEPGNEKNFVQVVDAKTLKSIKKLRVGKEVMDMIQVGGEIYLAETDTMSIKLINTEVDEISKTIQLDSEPRSFATPLKHKKAIRLGI